jgi:predicted nucleotidyltransferase
MNKLLQQLEEFNQRMLATGARFALIGGFALGVHQVQRSTRDIDFLLAQADADIADSALKALGYRCIHRSADAANYRRGTEAIDFIYAYRTRALALLTQAEDHQFGDQQVRVVSVEGLIGLKLQAMANDPSRKQDALDIEMLFNKHRADLDFELLKDYFQLFNKTDFYAELIGETSAG